MTQRSDDVGVNVCVDDAHIAPRGVGINVGSDDARVVRRRRTPAYR